MKHKLIIFALFGLLILLKSCLYSDCEVVYIPEEHKFWLNLYEENDTLIFESNLGYFDTLVLDDFETRISPCNRFELGPYQYKSQRLYLRSSVRDMDFLLRVSSDVSDCYIKLAMNSLIYCYREENDSVIQVINYAEDNLVDEFLLVIDTTNCSHYNNGDYISFSVSNKKGLIEYETKYGEVFSLLKHISSSKK